MLFHRNRKLTECHLIILCLLLTQCCKGKSQLINSPQTIIATLGHDIILPCHLVPGEDASDLTLEWTRPDLNPRFVHVCRSGQELVDKKHELFKKRTSLFTDELKFGNISLKLSKVKIHDQGTFRCFIPEKQKQSFVQLVVGSDAVTSPVITLADIDKANGVVLHCESKGWHPKPEMSWLDGEENLLSAGPAETVGGPGGLYTVRSRLTVEKGNNFTCRVQQKNMNRTRETHICILDVFYKSQSMYFSFIVGLSVSLAVCSLLIMLLAFIVWKRQKISKTKRSQMAVAGEEEKNHRSNSNKIEDQSVPEEDRENEQLMTYAPVEEKRISKLTEMKLRNETELKRLQKELETEGIKDEQTKRRKAEEEVTKLREELKNKNKEFTEMKGRNEYELKRLPKELETTRIKLQDEQTKRRKAEKEVKELREELKNKNKELTEIKLRNESELKRLPGGLETVRIKPATSKVSQAQGGRSSAGSIIVDEIDQEGKYVRLKNMSHEEQQLQGYELSIQVNNRKPIIFTFYHPLTLTFGKTVTIWAERPARPNPKTDLTSEKSWGTGKKLLVTLYSNHEEEVAMKEVCFKDKS